MCTIDFNEFFRYYINTYNSGIPVVWSIKMDVVKTILLVAFVIVCVLLVLLVLIQNEDDNGMGGVFGGGQSAAFGSHSATVLTNTTAVLAVLFFVMTFFLAFLNKGTDAAKKAAEMGNTAAEVQGAKEETGTTGGNWYDDKE